MIVHILNIDLDEQVFSNLNKAFEEAYKYLESQNDDSILEVKINNHETREYYYSCETKKGDFIHITSHEVK